MISTANIITDLSDVPRNWIFEYYLGLSQKLTGQNIKMLSAFNKKDKVPSMFVYFDACGYYKFKDFSSGYQGDGIELVKHLYNLPSRGSAVQKILIDYQEFVKNNTVPTYEVKFHDKFKVVDYEMRHWNSLDKSYWTAYSVSSHLLEQYNVVPLEYFTMEKTEEDGTITSFTFRKPYVYGYFREDGSLYKIYMPKIKDKKFIKVANYIQGTDQLKYDCKYLLIVSSLKDLLCFKRLGIGGIEAIAPDSENTMIGEKAMDHYMHKYQKVIVLFDNDEPGEKAAARYLEKYNVSSIQLKMSKDLSDSVKDHGLSKVREELYPLLKKKINKNNE